MKTRCKFRCDRIINHEHNTDWYFSPVYHGDDKDHENFKFNEASPGGSFHLMTCNNKYQGELPRPGKEYYFDISEVSAVEEKMDMPGEVADEMKGRD